MAPTYDFDPTASNWLVRAYHTPVQDALRGHLSARLDVRREIAAAALPLPLPGLVYTVVRRSRLWRREQHDVARELIAHFADGLAAGTSGDKLAADFGSPEQAARLIRRAKLRSRPLWWRSARAATRLFLAAFVAGLLTYSAMAARFYWGRPIIAHNYWHEINAARRTSNDQRAWPLYREALIKLGKTEILPEWLDDGPSGKHWDEAMAALARHRESLELMREGAKRPHFGWLLGDPADHAATAAGHQEWMFTQQSADDNEDLISALLQGPQEIRRVSRLLAADARRAAIAGQGATVLEDVTAILSLSEQQFAPAATLVEQLIGIAIFGQATEAVGRTLADYPAALTDEQLQHLAHRIAAYRGGTLSLDFTSERMIFDDLLQRAYTDDGNGDGRITRDGLRLLADSGGGGSALFSSSVARDPKAAWAVLVASPGVAALVGSRRENRELYHRLMDEMIAAHQGPPWQWDRKAFDAYEARMCEMATKTSEHLKYWLVANMLPALAARNSAGERSVQVRDAAEVAIALEIWRRRHGEWPRELAELVPDLLPAVPVDRTDGKPLRYVVRDGQALVYSIGADRDDDGGRASGIPDQSIPTWFGPETPADAMHQPSDSDGDWILWPPRKEPPQDDEPTRPPETPGD